MSTFQPTDAQSKFAAIVAKLTSPLEFETAAQALMDMMPALADLPAGAFCGASAEHVGRNSQRVPSYGQLRKMLELWWSINRPKGNDIGADDPTLDANDRQIVASWQRRRSEMIAGDTLAAGLSVLRRWPRAFRYVCRIDTEAASVAVRRGWHTDALDATAVDQRMTDDWGSITPAQIAAKLANLRGLAAEGERGVVLARALTGFLRSAVERYAPHHLHLLPELAPARRGPVEPVSNVAAARAEAAEGADARMAQAIDEERALREQAFIAEHGRKPGELSPEQLEALRAADPAVQKARAHQERQQVEQRWTQEDPAPEPPPATRRKYPWDMEEAA
jgi:hypothetical protein